MKKFKMLAYILTIMFLGIGAVNAAGITFPQSIEIPVGEKRDINFQVDDLAIILDIANSDPTVATTSSSAAVKADDVNPHITVEGLKVGETVLTISSDDASIISLMKEYNMETKTVLVKVVDNSGNALPGNEDPANVTPSNEPTKDDLGEDEPVKNPKTGISDYIIPVLVINVILIGGYFLVKKFTPFKRF